MLVNERYGHPRRLRGLRIKENSLLQYRESVLNLPKIQYCYAHFVNGIAWENLPIEGDLNRFAVLDEIYRQGVIKNVPNDNILVHVFDDEVIFAGGGFHRLAIAKILNLESIPVDVGLIYKGR